MMDIILASNDFRAHGFHERPGVSFWAVYQHLENRLDLGEGVGFPDLSRLARTHSRLLCALERNLKRLVEAVPLATQHRRRVGRRWRCPTASSTAETRNSCTAGT
jgi:hypothetical protein